MILTILVTLAVLMSLIAALMFAANLPLFCVNDDTESTADEDSPIAVSVLIPARDEEAGIQASVMAALANERSGIEIEVVVMDDHSSDRTAEIVASIAADDSRVRCLAGTDLPLGWNGKQHACFQLAKHAKYDRMMFLDADVRLQPDAVSRLVRYQDRSRAMLLSAFPHQETGTWSERLLIPMMHYILLCYLPFGRMRQSSSPAYAAGCGQLFLTMRTAYEQAGTHQAIAGSRHDGLKLPSTYRAAGLMTDVIDGTPLADCRMYQGFAQVVRGVLKNANEGIATVRMIVPFSFLLLSGSVLPVATAVAAVLRFSPIALVFSIIAILLGHAPRAVAAIRFRQSWLGVALHSVAVTLFVLLQWIALAQSLVGYQVAWRGRASS